MNPRLPILAFLLLSVSTAVFSQDKPDLFLRAEAVFKAKDPRWKIEKIYSPTSDDPFSESIVLRSEEGQASVQLTIWKRLEDAVSTFDGESIGFDRGMGKRMEKSILPNFGDTNHFWTNAASEAWPTLKFRKGTVLVTVFGPSIKTVKSFGHEMLELIADQTH